MAFRDLLLHIDSYPFSTPPESIDEAVRWAACLGGKLTALAVEAKLPIHSNRVADYLIGLSAMADAEEARSRDACRDGLAHFTAAAKAQGVFQDTVLTRCIHYDTPDHVTKAARSRDLTILPVIGGFDGPLDVAQAVVFGSGRPTLVFRTGHAADLTGGPARVVVAWDGSRCAARALADALPILKIAREVRLLTVVNEKPEAGADLALQARRHLLMHGVDPVIDEVDAEGASIGAVFDAYLKRQSADLLVMGAYGHSRAREFLLGGATFHTLSNPVTAVLLSH